MENFISIKDAVKVTSLSRSSLYRAIRAGTFPKPRVIGLRRVGFVCSEVESWVRERVGQRSTRRSRAPRRRAR